MDFVLRIYDVISDANLANNKELDYLIYLFKDNLKCFCKALQDGMLIYLKGGTSWKW